MNKNAFLLFSFSVIIVMSYISTSYGMEDYITSLFRTANDAYERGLELEGEAREKELIIAAANYEKLINQANIKNGFLYYNLGNAYFHLNELGKAILNYRRAQRFLPNYPELRENLRTALAKRQDRIDKTQMESIWRTLFFWHYLIGTRSKALFFSSFFTLIWILLFIRLYQNSILLKWVIILSILLAAFLGASMMMERYEQNHIKSGVIIVKEVDAKKAPYSNAESEFIKPLHEGTEFQLIEERSGWFKIKLDDGKTTWIPAESSALI